jgi:hypothetical protein
MHVRRMRLRCAVLATIAIGACKANHITQANNAASQAATNTAADITCDGNDMMDTNMTMDTNMSGNMSSGNASSYMTNASSGEGPVVHRPQHPPR